LSANLLPPLFFENLSHGECRRNYIRIRCRKACRCNPCPRSKEVVKFRHVGSCFIAALFLLFCRRDFPFSRSVNAARNTKAASGFESSLGSIFLADSRAISSQLLSLLREDLHGGCRRNYMGSGGRKACRCKSCLCVSRVVESDTPDPRERGCFFIPCRREINF
jgi:hypothetical protein